MFCHPATHRRCSRYSRRSPAETWSGSLAPSLGNWRQCERQVLSGSHLKHQGQAIHPLLRHVVDGSWHSNMGSGHMVLGTAVVRKAMMMKTTIAIFGLGLSVVPVMASPPSGHCEVWDSRHRQCLSRFARAAKNVVINHQCGGKLERSGDAFLVINLHDGKGCWINPQLVARVLRTCQIDEECTVSGKAQTFEEQGLTPEDNCQFIALTKVKPGSARPIPIPSEVSPPKLK
jgi:hypothetical protein